MISKIYRSGAIGALLDEYERAVADLMSTIEFLPDVILTHITDPLTKDENCKSLQAILSHIVNSGFGYATSIHNLKGHQQQRPQKIFHTTVQEYLNDLRHMLVFTENVLKEFNDSELEQLDPEKKIKAGWGQVYDVEQLMEHAIVHVLRHRRQIEKIKISL